MRLSPLPGVAGTPMRAQGVTGEAAPATPVDSAVRVRGSGANRGPGDITQFLKPCVGSGVRAVLNAQGASTNRVDVLTGKPYAPHPGGIIAAPSVSGPEYRYVWDRDSALCARALVGSNDARALEGMKRYVDWAYDHHQRAEMPPPFEPGSLHAVPGYEGADKWLRTDRWAGLGDVRVSLDGTFDPYGWGRPQNDGQALRALTLIDIYGAVKDATVRQKILWCLRRDLDYVARAWPDVCFDLWEETLATKHYHTRECQAGALHAAIDFIKREGVLQDRLNDYAKAAAAIDAERSQFWNGRYIEASLGVLNRDATSPKQTDLDANVILAAIHSGRIDSRVMATAHLCEVRDQKRFPVNADVSPRLAPAIGRYTGDVYEGGGGFYMLTAGFAELYYMVSEQVRVNGIDIDADNRDFIAAACPSLVLRAGMSFAPGSAEANSIAAALLRRGDAFIRRIAKHVTVDTDPHGNPRVRIPEQLDGTTGKDRSAPDLTWSSACMITAAAARERAVKAQPRFPFDYTIADVMGDRAKAKAFVEDYFDHEAPFFAIARDPKTGLTYDGVDLDRTTREVIGPRRITAPSKECSDIAVMTKILGKNPLALRLVEKGKDPHHEAVRILTQKIDSYERFARDYPGYGGFMPWIKIHEDGTVTPADDHWQHSVPSLDNGEWVFSLIAVERALRQSGETALADRYKSWIDKLRKNVRRVFFDEHENAVRGQAHISDIRDPNPTYTSDGYIRGPHGVYEGAMILDFVSLYADPPLTGEQVTKLWAQTKITRVETPYGTTMQGFWYSSHEIWRALFMPLRDHHGWRTLLRNMEIVRTQLTNSPGELASINSPYSGRQDEPGPPYAGDIGPSQSVALEKLTPYQFYTIYGVFPLLLEQYAKPDERQGVAWLLNSLRARNAETSIGSGESVNNDGSEAAPMKTADGSFLNWLALMGGVVDEVRAQMKDDGAYDKFLKIAGGEFDESFAEPLKTPVGFALPKSSVPWTPPRRPTSLLAVRSAHATTRSWRSLLR